MNKEWMNKICRKFGFELHGLGYMQSLKKAGIQQHPFSIQKEITGNNVKVIFDIGANRGDTVMEYKNYFPDAGIYAFEPFPLSFTQLCTRTNEYKDICCFQNAVADSEGTKIMYVNQNVDTNSLLPSVKMGLQSDNQVITKEEIEVQTITIDAFCEKQRITQIDILKMDIQGGELSALMGANKLLSGKKIKLIYTESFFKEQYLDQPLFYDIAKYLKNFDYHLQDIYNPYYGNGAIAWCDAMFLPEV